MSKVTLSGGVWSGFLSFVLAGLGGITVASAWTWPWYLGWASIVTGVTLFAWGVRIKDKPLWRVWRLFKPSIPIAFKNIRRVSFGTYPLPNAPEIARLMAFTSGPVTIANISETKSVSLELRLHLTSNDGWNMKLEASPVCTFGDVRMFDPEFLINPINIKPGEAVTGKLVFLFQPFDDNIRGRMLGKLVRAEFQEHIIVDDIFSGAEIRLPLPASYRGE